MYIVPVLAYVIVANPATYKLTRNVLGDWVANADGAANVGGLILHAFVYLLLAGLLYKLLSPMTSGFGGSKPMGADCYMPGECKNDCVKGKCT